MKITANFKRYGYSVFGYLLVLFFINHFAIAGDLNSPITGSWVPIAQPNETGSSRALLSTKDGLYVGTSSGLYFSSDNGKSWQLITDQSIAVLSLIETPNKQMIIGTYRNGLIKVIPNEQDWQRVGLSDAFYIWDLISIGNTIFASSISNEGIAGVYSSRDNGSSWQPTALAELEVWSLSSPNNRHLYAGTNNGLYVSTDLGKTWALRNDGFDEGITVSQVSLVNNNLLASTGTLRSPGSGVFRFDKKSNKWQKFGAGLPTSVTVNSLVLKDEMLIAATAAFDGDKSGLYISQDFGETWFSTNFTSTEANHLILNNKNDLYVGTEGAGVWYSQDLKNWTSVSAGIRNWDVFSIYETKDLDLLAATSNGIWRLKSKTNVWLEPNIKLGASDFKQTSNNVLLSTAESNLLISKNQSQSWREVSLDGQYLVNLFVDGNRWYALDLRKPVKYSEDKGKSWQTLSIPEGQAARSMIKANNGDLLVSTREGIYRSDDNGRTWHLSHEDFYVWNFAKIGNGHLLASVTGRGMFRSRDNGQSWEEANNGFGEQPIRSAWSIVMVNKTIYLAAYNRGFFQSKNNGASWDSMSQDLKAPMALSLFATKSGVVYGGTSAGIYKWTE